MSASLNWIPCSVDDRLAERDPLLRVVDRVVGRALGDPDGLRGGAQACALERAERDSHTAADLADHVLLRNPHVLEHR